MLPKPVAPSPNVQLYDAIVCPGAAVDVVPLKNTGALTKGCAGENVNVAVGSPTAATLTVCEAEFDWPTSSVTVNCTV